MRLLNCSTIGVGLNGVEIILLMNSHGLSDTSSSLIICSLYMLSVAVQFVSNSLSRIIPVKLDNNSERRKLRRIILHAKYFPDITLNISFSSGEVEYSFHHSLMLCHTKFSSSYILLLLRERFYVSFR